MAISNEFGTQTTSRSIGSAHRGMAFLIEALVVLAFLMMSLAVFVRLFSSAQLEGIQSNRRSQAIMMATNTAEVFSANPTEVERVLTADGLTTTCDVEAVPHDAGTLYNATITVSDGEAELYVLRTARYVSSMGGGTQ